MTISSTQKMFGALRNCLYTRAIRSPSKIQKQEALSIKMSYRFLLKIISLVIFPHPFFSILYPYSKNSSFNFSDWLTAHPASLSGKELKFQTVLNSSNKDEIVRLVVDKELHGLTYERVEKWFEYLNKVVKLDCPSKNQIAKLAEIKASRDILVHNAGIVNVVYRDKSKKLARFQAGELLDLPENYIREPWQLLGEIIREISEAGIAKAKK